MHRGREDERHCMIEKRQEGTLPTGERTWRTPWLFCDNGRELFRWYVFMVSPQRGILKENKRGNQRDE